MKQVMRLVMVLAAGFPLSSSAFAAEDCLPDGQTADLSFDMPQLPGPGFPKSAQWVKGTGNPQGFEHDYTTPNDPMGSGHPGGGFPIQTSILEVENKGGNLSGPNGTVQNGFPEGPCVEVLICWTYIYEASVQQCTPTTQVTIKIETPGGTIGGSVGTGTTCITVVKIFSATTCSGTQDVCPC